MTALAARALRQRSLDVDESFASRRLSRALVEEADVVLTAERSHRGVAIALSASSLSKTFTIRQFARMCRAAADLQLHPRDGHELLQAARSARSKLQPVAAHAEEIPDPVRGGYRRFKRTAELIGGAIDEIVGALGPA